MTDEECMEKFRSWTRDATTSRLIMAINGSTNAFLAREEVSRGLTGTSMYTTLVSNAITAELDARVPTRAASEKEVELDAHVPTRAASEKEVELDARVPTRAASEEEVVLHKALDRFCVAFHEAPTMSALKHEDVDPVVDAWNKIRKSQLVIDPTPVADDTRKERP